MNVSFPEVKASGLLEALAGEVAASAGSACHAGETTITPVLGAMGVASELAMGVIRLSTGRMTTEAEARRAAAAIATAVR